MFAGVPHLITLSVRWSPLFDYDQCTLMYLIWLR